VNIHIKTLEPLSESLVVVCIRDQGIGSVEYNIHALPVGKAFQGCAAPRWQISDCHSAQKTLVGMDGGDLSK